MKQQNHDTTYKDFSLLSHFNILWKGKFHIVSFVLTFTVVSWFFSGKQEPEWIASIQVAAPDIEQYQELVDNVELYDFLYSSNNLNSPLKKGIESEALLKAFIENFNLLDNKLEFLSESVVFQDYLTHNNVDTSSQGELDLEWAEKITANLIESDLTSSTSYSLEVVSIESNISNLLLKDYIAYTQEATAQELTEEINTEINTLFKHEQSKYEYSKELQRSLIDIEINKAKVSYEITKKANVDLPYFSYSNDSIFNTNDGYKIYKAKIESLTNLKQDEIITPSMAEVVARLSFLNQHNALREDIKFQSFYPLAQIDDTSQLKNQKAFFIILGALFGLLSGVSFVYFRNSLK
ncbi:Wzz/FepE/Etk N-terminal domain-containing protein [Photobacterium rosenbergii]|uniref:Wzz/FepE/Etk N-terminal domain-containing protein n=1 Tax=Photobacterium rosenbergii TaxID=294936 RepID=A0ABU3ZPT5_9GAMM|nr:Wzz/FepE/Etk N-terminal domain-containing protein [Photobacterium rosenbergii]MDV5172109.1 Wzz/FepE/Etk N-terminal domain-containing protein [Photobacterium rosenbergii]